MENIEYFHDDCQTAGDVMARAQRVRENRRSAFSKPPQVIYIRESAPEPVVKLVKPSLVEMLHAIADHYKIDQVMLMENIAELMPREDRRTVYSVQSIQRAAANASGVPLYEMLSARRTDDVCKPRQMAMALCKRLTLKSLPEIGRKFCRDHTTVLHAVRKYEPLIDHVGLLMAPTRHRANGPRRC